MNKKNKRNVKMIALAVAAFFALGIVGMALTQTQVGYAAPKDSAIGYINMGKAFQNHPDMPGAQTELQNEGSNLQKEFDEKSKDMNDQQKRDYSMQLQQRMQETRIRVLGAIQQKIEETAKKVASAKGLSVVLHEEMIVFGGTDITDDVIKAFASK